MVEARRTLGAAVLVAAALSLAPATPSLAEPTLAVWDGAQWRRWWSGSAPPVRWHAPHPVVARAVAWSEAQAGLEVGTVRFAGDNRARRFSVALLRFDPAQMRLRLGAKRTPSGRVLPWSVADIPDEAAFALNAGMFDSAGPWGWLVLDGEERQAPGVGPLSSAIVIDAPGTVRIVASPEIAATRTSGTAQWAVQSYPTALIGGVVPPPLRIAGTGVDHEHRDARLAIASLHDGRVIVALTRFNALGDAFGAVPLGPTLPEMTAILGALGARDAVFLDGGLSAQVAVRHADSRVERWEGMRGVPLFLAGFRR